MGADDARAVSGADAAALHLRIRGDIVERIRSGAWRPGHRLPVEHELMEVYGCARATVNKALAALSDAGLIVRRRKAGSFVAHPKIHSVVLDIPDISAEIAGRGEVYAYELLSRASREADGIDRRALDVPEPFDVLALRCLHWASGRPFALEERLINLSALPQAADVNFAEVAPSTWLLAHVPWTEAEHRISASSAGRSAAACLQIAPSTPCLVLERRTWRCDDRITQVRLTFPGEAYDLIARFAPQVG